MGCIMCENTNGKEEFKDINFMLSKVHIQLRKLNVSKQQIDNSIPKSTIDYEDNSISLFNSVYFVDKSLGKGTFGYSIRLLEKSTECAKTLKVIEKDSLILLDENLDKRKLKKNLKKNLHLLDHPNIAKVIDIYETKEALFLVREYSDTTLLENVNSQANFSEKEIKRVMRQILQAISFLHEKQIAHGNLCLNNVLISEDSTVKVSDIGLNGLFLRNNMKCNFHSLPPEYFHGSKESLRCDEWGCGVIMHYLYFKEYPFNENKLEDFLESLVSREFLSDIENSQISKEGKEIILGFFENDPERRLSVEDALKLPYFKEEEIVLQKETLDYMIKSLFIFIILFKNSPNLEPLFCNFISDSDMYDEKNIIETYFIENQIKYQKYESKGKLIQKLIDNKVYLNGDNMSEIFDFFLSKQDSKNQKLSLLSITTYIEKVFKKFHISINYCNNSRCIINQSKVLEVSSEEFYQLFLNETPF